MPMTALKINRFSLSEIDSVTIRCKRCGAGHIVKINGEKFAGYNCPSCGVAFGELVRSIYEALREAHKGLTLAGDFDVEFDIEEKG
jgi:transposase-like protein